MYKVVREALISYLRSGRRPQVSRSGNRIATDTDTGTGSVNSTTLHIASEHCWARTGHESDDAICTQFPSRLRTRLWDLGNELQQLRYTTLFTRLAWLVGK